MPFHDPLTFDLHKVLERIRHFLPTQAPLKDFIHHNSLHAFQHEHFKQATREASEIFGYQTYLTLEEFRHAHHIGKITKESIQKIIADVKGQDKLAYWYDAMCNTTFNPIITQRIGQIRTQWNNRLHINMDKAIHPTLFRLTAAYLDQGISLYPFPGKRDSFLEDVLALDDQSAIKLFQSGVVRNLIKEKQYAVPDLLDALIGNPNYFECYLLDQQFAHPGWSGMVAYLEKKPSSLFEQRSIGLEDYITLELLLELDYAEKKLGKDRKPLISALEPRPDYFQPLAYSEYWEVLYLWQGAAEWSYHSQVLIGLTNTSTSQAPSRTNISFQAVLCIDDREESLRRHLEAKDHRCETFGVAGFFNVPFYFKPEGAQFNEKSCPAPVNPKHLVCENVSRNKYVKDRHFNYSTHGIITGWLHSTTIGIASAWKMASHLWFPKETNSMSNAFRHIDPNGKLTIEYEGKLENGLQVGFTVEEMTNMVENLLRAIGLTQHFAPIIYLIGHGASSVNNPYFAGYDCGACSGRAGSANARVACTLANNQEVRAHLEIRGINIPETTIFMSGIHDTTRDEILFFETENLSNHHRELHEEYQKVFLSVLQTNAVERARRFERLEYAKKTPSDIHKLIKRRAYSLFEPRPEWNHATNAVCIIGRRKISQSLFLDRRAFLPSYDPYTDPDGAVLSSILNAIAPVCGGINLEYYFSRVDNERLGAGSKLPHNIMGLIGVVNGLDGDLRTGLPAQMVNIHEPLRLMVVVEQEPEVINSVLKKNPSTKNWFDQEWIHLIAKSPDAPDFFQYREQGFAPLDRKNFNSKLDMISDEEIFDSIGPLPVKIIKS